MKEHPAMVWLLRLLPLLAVLASLVWGAATRKASGFAFRENAWFASCVVILFFVNVRLVVEQRKKAKASVASA